MVRGLTPTPNESSVPPWEMLAECVLAAHHTTHAKTRHVSHVVEMAPCPQWHDHERQEQARHHFEMPGVALLSALATAGFVCVFVYAYRFLLSVHRQKPSYELL